MKIFARVGSRYHLERIAHIIYIILAMVNICMDLLVFFCI